MAREVLPGEFDARHGGGGSILRLVPSFSHVLFTRLLVDFSSVSSSLFLVNTLYIDLNIYSFVLSCIPLFHSSALQAYIEFVSVYQALN